MLANTEKLHFMHFGIYIYIYIYIYIQIYKILKKNKDHEWLP